ncbi:MULTISPECIES: hypothetical protein [Nostoc]|uniref:Uncharacterized protein n=1 Tax=Nostoc paludosum FACHB-159 TaxID=2692908 RepID=A0ABR8KK49_9NOSO|nr:MULTISPECIES: hypothetical protein [Nostoc]MBD2683602.1 hypothetical protein [Nostoc sp. FACHB-857]MBD2739933.1 hypothetical protein [Nostoc paludosum FACHB-159]
MYSVLITVSLQNKTSIISAPALLKGLIMRGWVNDPHSGGVKIPEQVKQRMKQRFFNNGTFYGTPEEAFQSSALYLDSRNFQDY